MYSTSYHVAFGEGSRVIGPGGETGQRAGGPEGETGQRAGGGDGSEGRRGRRVRGPEGETGQRAGGGDGSEGRRVRRVRGPEGETGQRAGGCPNSRPRNPGPKAVRGDVVPLCSAPRGAVKLEATGGRRQGPGTFHKNQGGSLEEHQKELCWSSGPH
ncbi:unnamed protein product [Gadus morhua 'NCC']